MFASFADLENFCSHWYKNGHLKYYERTQFWAMGHTFVHLKNLGWD